MFGEKKSNAGESSSAAPVMYRKYRKGELPDIEMAPSALIAPLQAVALDDAETSKMLFTNLLTSIGREMKEKEGQDDDFCRRVDQLLTSIVNRCKLKQRNSCCVAAVMEHLWTNNGRQLDVISPRRIVTVVRATQLQQLGILLLENRSSARKRKRARTEEVNDVDDNWFCAAQLYGDIDDVDSKRAVVAQLSHCSDVTEKAVEAEARSDWNTAIQFYRFLSQSIILFYFF